MKTENQPLVSIIVPSYNQGHFIEDTLKSILNQNYPNLEVVVFDGGSTDETVSILERYADRIRFTSKPDNGQSDAVNKGFRAAKGDIIGWLNSDDIYPDRRAVSRMVEAFTEYPDADLIYGDFIEIDGENRVLKIYKRPAFSFSRLLRIGYISQPATFIRKRVINSILVREDLTYAMDTEYWLRAYTHGFKFRHIDALIAAERLHEDAKCVADTDEMVAEARKIRMGYGASFGHLYPLLRFLDRVLLFVYRIFGIRDLISIRRQPERLTIPLSVEGAVKRTIMFRAL